MPQSHWSSLKSHLAGLIAFAACAVGAAAQPSVAQTSSPAATVAQATSPSRQPAKIVTIRFGWQPAAQFAYLYANDYKLFAKYGIQIDATKFNSGVEELSAIASGSLDVAQLGAPPWISALNQGMNLQIIFSLINNTLDGLYVNPKSGINTAADMVGHTIGVTRGSGADGSLNQVLAKLNIKPNTIKLVNLRPSDLVIAYDKGDIEGAWTWDTIGLRMRASGAKLVTTSIEHGFFQPSFYAVNAEFLKKEPDAVARLVAALGEGAEQVNKDPTTVSKRFADLAGLSETDALYLMKQEPNSTLEDMLDPKNPTTFVGNTGFASQLQQLAEVMHSIGNIDKVPPNLASYLNAQVIRDAIAIRALHK